MSPILVPLMPIGLVISDMQYSAMFTTVTFDWDPPSGSGPEGVVDNYTILIMPKPISSPQSNVVTAAPWNVTLNYNIEYSATISATNCAGASESFSLQNIEYSKFYRFLKISM